MSLHTIRFHGGGKERPTTHLTSIILPFHAESEDTDQMKKDIPKSQKKEYPGLIAIKIDISDDIRSNYHSGCFACINNTVPHDCTETTNNPKDLEYSWIDPPPN